MRNTIFILALILASSLQVNGQFYTITKTVSIEKKINSFISEVIDTDTVAYIHPDDMPALTPDDPEYWEDPHPYATARKRNVRKPKESSQTDNKVTKVDKNVSQSVASSGLPELTIPNLIREIKKNNLQYPDVVLAQAILETGWFKSPVCRNMNNLFGLTNPRTHYYYSFNHWTESVRAYYTKVQYRYKGGDYLKWLDKIGYAEAGTYIQKVADVMRTLRKRGY